MAEVAWPNFKTFFERFKHHPALDPGSVEDTAVTPSSIVAAEEVVEQEGKSHTPSSSRCPSRQSNRSVGGDTDSEEDDEIHILPKKSKEDIPLVARVGKKKGKQTGATLFLVAFG